MGNLSLLIVGVGGQGVLVASKVIANVIKEKSYDIKVSEVHGLSQRGGSVVSHIKFGDKVYSPLVEEGGADIIIAFEQLEALRWIKYLKHEGTIIINNKIINPSSDDSQQNDYTCNAIDIIKKHKKNVICVNESELFEEYGNIKATNMFLVGILMKQLNFERDVCIRLIKQLLSSKYLSMNLEAFDKGYEYLNYNIKTEIENIDFMNIIESPKVMEKESV